MSTKHDSGTGGPTEGSGQAISGRGGMPVSRRAVLHGGLAGAAGLLLADPLARPVRAARPEKAKAVIQIWMWGGPSHLDTFDPKPAAGSDYCGPLNKPIQANVAGVKISELLPQLAKQADKIGRAHV